MRRLRALAVTMLVGAGLTGMAWVAGGALSKGPSGDGLFSLVAKDGLYTLHAKDALVRDILRDLARQSGLDIQVDSKLLSKISTDLEDQPVEKVLAALTRSRALVYQAKNGEEQLSAALVTSEQEPIAVDSAAVVRKGSNELLPGVLTNTKRPVGELRNRSAHALLLQNAVVDTDAARKGSRLVLPAQFTAPVDAAYQIVQFDHAISDADRAALQAMGVVISHYVPNSALAVKVTVEQLAHLMNMDGVLHVEPYHPYFKMSKDLLEVLTQAEPSKEATKRVNAGVFNVLSFRESSIQETLKAAGYQVSAVQTLDGREVVTVHADPSKLVSLLGVESVQWVEPTPSLKAMNDLAATRVRVAALRTSIGATNLTGQGVIVGVTDTGIDYKNTDFAVDPSLPTTTGSPNSRITAYLHREGGPTSDGLPGDNEGHGTHVSGSILGNGAKSASVVASPGSGSAPYAAGKFAGMAPEARLVMIEDFNSFSSEEQAEATWSSGARISNNSWGADVFEYGVLSAMWDGLVRDAVVGQVGNQELIAFFAAGNSGSGQNDGSGGVAHTVGQPGNAKNVITIGAVELPRYANNLTMYNSYAQSDSDWQISSFSSRGPVTATDVRFKPDVVAPGSYVLSVQSSETLTDDLLDPFLPNRDYRYGNVNSGTNYAFFSGTSMATPIAAGAGALFFQYFTNTFGREPSPSLMKAALVAGARVLNNLHYKMAYDSALTTITEQGFGMLDISRSILGPRIQKTDSIQLLDQSETSPVITGGIFQRQIVVNPGEGGLKVVLAWSDPAGTPGNAYQLVNDIDLIVRSPGGGGYLGNQYDLDGVHSRKFNPVDSAWGDEYNNVETVLIRDAAPGTYTIQVYGYNVPQGAQAFSLVVMKGVGIEGRTPGDSLAVALGTNDRPVMAWSASDDGGHKQIYVKKWEGNYGVRSDMGTWRRLDDQWFGIRDSARLTGISQSLEDSVEPSVAVKDGNIFVAWRQKPMLGDTSTPDRIYLRQFDGSDWLSLGNSTSGNGVSGNPTYSAGNPVVAVGSNGYPVVAWLQKVLTGTLVRAASYDGSQWVGLGASLTNQVPGAWVATNVDMVVDTLGRVVVAWEEQTTQRVKVQRWNGSSWSDLGSVGNAPYAGTPRLAAGANGDFYIAWKQTPNGDVPTSNFYYQVYAARNIGGAFNAMAGSMSHPGVSIATNVGSQVIDLDIAVQTSPVMTNVVVAWQSGSNTANSILARRFNGTAWSGVYGSQAAPGVALNSGVSVKPNLIMDSKGLPLVGIVNNDLDNNTSDVQMFTPFADRTAPEFAGLQTAIGGTNGNVVLGWLPAVDDISTTIVYRIYRGTQTVSCGVSPSCNVSNVFSTLVGVVTNLTTYNVTGLSPNLIYCFGVRAMDEANLSDENEIIRSAGPVSGSGDNDSDCLANAVEVAAGTEPCVRDTDGDGMWDGWEWTYSTNNVFKTNTISLLNTNKFYLSPLDNGFDNVRTVVANDGTAGQLPSDDPDGDGLSNYEEFQWWLTFGGAACGVTNINLNLSPNPTMWDTDGDGMPDGWEVINGLNPTQAGDAVTDLDGDGLNNLQEYLAGTDPRNVDSDGDGLSDGAEVNVYLTSPVLADSDQDGLDDGYEVSLGSDPRRADSNGNYVSDGQMNQLGLSPTGSIGGYRMVLPLETFETSSATNWISSAPNGVFPQHFWHLTTAEPKPTNTSGFVYFEDHSSSHAFRAANDPSKTNANATYTPSGGPQALIMALTGPMLSTNAIGTTNLFIRWKEYYETEPVKDFMVLQMRGGSTNWVQVSTPVSGLSGVTNIGDTNVQARWVSRVLDVSQFAGRSNVQVRFLFTADNVNNGFRGWWVDDVAIYEAVTISGWVRDNNGAPLEGATVRALGKGGQTNFIAGHRYVLPGTIFGEQRTAKDGSFSIAGLPLGNYYVKAEEDGHIDEFWDGQLFTNGYAFGNSFRPGVPSRDLVSTSGVLPMLTAGAISNAYFELERGVGRTFLGVTLPNAAGSAYPVRVDGATNLIWNGSTGTPALVAYNTTNANALEFNHPDWATSNTVPSFISDLSPGLHRPYVSTATLGILPLSEVSLREGEATLIILATNQAKGRLFVSAENQGSYGLMIDGVGITNKTPAIVDLAVGNHEVSLIITGSTVLLPPQQVLIPIGNRVDLTVSSNSLAASPGAVRIMSSDIYGGVVSGLQVFVNGILVDSNKTVEGRQTTPVTVTSLVPGQHHFVLRGVGYRDSDFRTVEVFSDVTNETTYVMYQADRDFDAVGDVTEVTGYTNIFLYSRGDDPDMDGLNNLQEFDLFRQFGIAMNPFNPDSDGDRAPDGAEVGFDGRTNLFAFTLLYTNSIQFSSSARALFVGSYLAGVDNFGSGVVTASVAGDQFVGFVTHPAITPPTAEPALTVFTNIPSFPEPSALSSAHTAAAEVFADAHPGRVDTDGDGLYDGFEYLFGPATNIAALRLLDAGQLTEDMDADGLSNWSEFLGRDRLSNTNDWTNPGAADTDGDMMPDGFEFMYGLDPLDPSDAFQDPDGDGLVNLGEFFAGTSPGLADTDADGLPDYEEVAIYGTDPLNQDTDGDGLLDGQEVWDRDLDGVRDGGFFPMWAGGDLDNDGYIDGPTDWDTDGDGMPDGFEVLDNNGRIRPIGLNPYDPTDGDQDADGDGLSNLQEYLVRDALYGNPPTSFPLFEMAWNGYVPLGWPFGGGRPHTENIPVWDYSTDPFNADSDGDGMPDGFEVEMGLHPEDPIVVDGNILVRYRALSNDGDLDGDGLWNAREYSVRFALDGNASSNAAISLSTHPWRNDTDNDGLDDGEEANELFASPVVSDTDHDRLMDGMGVTGYWGEVQSVRRTDYQLVECSTCTWADASAWATNMPYPLNTNVMGRLAVISDPREQIRIQSLLSGSETFVALGMVDTKAVGIFDFTTTGEPFVFQHFATNEPATIALVPNAVYMRGDGYWGVMPAVGVPVSHFVVEWAATSETNHYDQAENDLWQLTWPLNDEIARPIWAKVVLPPGALQPPPRWGVGMAYNPAFERKNRRFEGGEAPGSRWHYSGVNVLDDRKIVVMGGNDGVDRYQDVWEFNIRSMSWRVSAESFLTPANISYSSQALGSGLSDFGVVTFMGYRDTKAASNRCPCLNTPWDCEGEAFGEPKNRPWNNGFQDSSYDTTYIVGGWNDQHEYLLEEPMVSILYKSTDDLVPVSEYNDDTDDNDAWEAAIAQIVQVTSNSIPVSTVTNYGNSVYYNTEDDGTKNDSTSSAVPLGDYSDFFYTVTTNGDVVTRTTTYRTNVAAGVRFSRAPFYKGCDRVVYAGLRLDVLQIPAFPTETLFTVYAEFDGVTRESVRAYTARSGDPNRSPTARLGGFYTSPSVDFVITNTGNWEIDVTPLVQAILTNDAWQGRAIGFVIVKTNGAVDHALFREDNSRLRVDWLPSYLSPPTWVGGTRVQAEQGEIPSRRKSFGIAYDHLENTTVLFGGINGRQVLGETYEAKLAGESNGEEPANIEPGDPTQNTTISLVRWVRIPIIGAAPVARWGHSMAYDDVAKRVVLFGGFDANNQPLNDLWDYDVVTKTWTEIKEFQDGQRPSPRGGVAMAFYGSESYKRGAGPAYSSTKRNRLVMFGGTDGKKYFNDTWVFDRNFVNRVLETQTTGNRWYIADPGGEQSRGPSPRAFAGMVYAQNGGLTPDPLGIGTFGFKDSGSKGAAAATVYLFGGRSGTLPNNSDTDNDYVDDGQEHELGGTAAGRDPRVNALINWNGVETVPYSFQSFGLSHGSQFWIQRPLVADLEAMSFNERGESYRSLLYTWQGWPMETTFSNQYYIIGDETKMPFEDPATNRVIYQTGIDAYSPDWTNMWYHRYPLNLGNPRDPRDVWRLGIPSNKSLGSNGAPPYAHSGRWVYGTSLDGSYPNDASMELYSPIFSLTLPSTSSVYPNNENSYFLMFHEWVDLADSNDFIRVDVVRPETPADVATRVSGLNRPDINLIPNRNNAANTGGSWRRTIVPLDILGNQSNLYIRFTLQSDGARQAGGWYIDDIAILQGSEISGTITNGAGTNVCLIGEVFNNQLQACTVADANGGYQFGLLPLGNYQLITGGTTNGPLILTGPNLVSNVTVEAASPAPSPEFTGITVNSPLIITWGVSNGFVYRLDYTTNLLSGAWQSLSTQTAGPGLTLNYTDTVSDLQRIYRVVVTNSP